MISPRTGLRDAIDRDIGRAEMQEKSEWEKTQIEGDSSMNLLLGRWHMQIIRLMLCNG